MDKTTRELVLESLVKVYKDAGYGNRITDSVLTGDIDKMSSGFFTHLFYGCIENNVYLDYILRQNIKTSVNKLNQYIHYILVMALYQFLFMDSVPDYSIVDESVKLAKRYQRRYSGFVNAVLRSFIRKDKRFSLPNPKKDNIKYLSVIYSHPEWLVDMWVKQYGIDFTEKLLKSNQEKAPTFVRYNSLVDDCGSREDFEGIEGCENRKDYEKINNQNINNIALHSTVFDDVFCLDEEDSLSDLLASSEFAKSKLYIQDLGASAVGHVVADVIRNKYSDGEFTGTKATGADSSLDLGATYIPTIIDMCAAPGGKSLHVASLLKNNARIFCWDIYEHRVNLIRQNASAHGASCIVAECKDSSVLDERYIERADVVMLDAPCSGLGTIRRHPDIKIHRKKEDINLIAQLQQKLLKTASKYVKKGGSLIYSTCTLSSVENEIQIHKFLSDNKNFTVVEQNHMNLPNSWYNVMYEKNIGVCLYPNIHGTDGFYICKMTKNS